MGKYRKRERDKVVTVSLTLRLAEAAWLKELSGTVQDGLRELVRGRMGTVAIAEPAPATCRSVVREMEEEANRRRQPVGIEGSSVVADFFKDREVVANRERQLPGDLCARCLRLGGGRALAGCLLCTED